MRIALLGLLKSSPFERALEHADKIGKCGPLFLEAVQCYKTGDRDRFEMLKEEIRDIEAECDRIKRNIRAHLPSRLLMPVEKWVFFAFLKEADKVIDCIKNALYWLSYYQKPLPDQITKDYLLLVREVSDFLGFLPELVRGAHTYFAGRQETLRKDVKDVIKEIRFREQESDYLEKSIIVKLCAAEDISPKTFFMMVRLVETTGDIGDHLENAADMMRAMVAR
jgi:hypothetical protein